MKNSILLINKLAKDNGFDVVGITNATTTNLTKIRFKKFLKDKFDADMNWLAEKKEVRLSPKKMWPNAKTAIVLGFNYGPKSNPLEDLNIKKSGLIAAYARRKDYHTVLKGRLKQIASQLASKIDTNVKVYVDTAPLMEKPLASQAGIGWQGKHTNLVSKKYGSWLLLATILISKKLPSQKDHADHCGSCTKCIDICPTGAIPEPYRLDSRKCISYLTIEHKGQIPIKYRKQIGNRIFGCDDCLAICPWNSFASETNDIKLSEKKGLNLLPLDKWLSFTEEEFRKFSSGTSIKRTGYIRMMRNCLIAAGNSEDVKLVNIVKTFLNSKNIILRGASIWSLKQLLKDFEFKKLKNSLYQFERKEEVKKEWIS
ncbi:MAG: tRNA epoxyqueuosine(34) reductase QueG [Candidatus Puniceispirillales bacterium]